MSEHLRTLFDAPHERPDIAYVEAHRAISTFLKTSIPEMNDDTRYLKVAQFKQGVEENESTF